MAKLTKGKLFLSALLLIFFIPLFFFFYGCGGSKGSDTAGGGTTTPAVDLSSIALNVPSSVTFGTPVTVQATVRDANGVLAQGAVVTFASSGLVAFTPTSATALTNALGVASILLNAASVDSAGATSITASAPVTTGVTTSTVTSAPVGITVNGAAVTINSLTLGSPSISAYGTSSVIAVIWVNGALATVPISVTFTSPCVASALATLTSPVTTILGTATSTYTDNNCNSGTDMITASVTGATASQTITVASPAASNIQFVSATPAIIGTSPAGAATLPKSSVVKFKVVDSNNNGKPNVLVDFTRVPASSLGGVILSPLSATSGADGTVTTSLTSGTVPTPIWVVATINGSSPAISTQSNQLTITTGLPTQNFFSLSAQTHNIEGWDYDGVTSTITIIASDRLGNPVPDETAVNFITEGGHFNSGTSTATCTTTGGTCTITFTSAEYRPIDETTTAHPNGAVAAVQEDGVTPITISTGGGSPGPPLFVQNGRVTMLAYAVGEKSFIDADGDNAYTTGETFYDLGDLYVDWNENGIWDSNPSGQPDLIEPFINYASGALACTIQPSGNPLPGNYATSPSKENTCDGAWGLNYVRREQIMILSSSHPLISEDTFTMGSNCLQTFSFWLMDENYNPMPAATTVSTANNHVSFTPVTSPISAVVSVGGTPVVDTTHAGGTRISLTVDGGSSCTGAGPVPYPAGTVDIVITTPKGLVTNKHVTVN